MSSNDSAKDTISPIKGDHHVSIRSSVRTPPPGFARSDAALLYGSSLNRAAAASAPPSSLFSDSFGVDRSASYLLRDDFQRLSNGSLSSNVGVNGDSSRFSDGLQQRTMSFNNIAEVLGEGLAESMGDSLEDSSGGLMRLLNGKISAGATNNAPAVSAEIDNFARQSRHSLNRRSSSNLAADGNIRFPEEQNRPSSQTQQTMFDRSNLIPEERTAVSHLQFSKQDPSFSRSDGVTVVEPSNTPNPQMSMNFANGRSSENVGGDINSLTQDMLQLNMAALNAGRASAPPQLFVSQSRGAGVGTISKNLSQQRQQRQVASSLQQRAAQIKEMQQENRPNKHMNPSPSHTPIPSFNNSPAKFGVQLPPSSTPTVGVVEDQAMKDLTPFTWEPSNSDAPMKTGYTSRAIAIFGVAALPLADVKSTCEAFGSLLYFRSEFFSSQGVLLIAYHDLRSASLAARELKIYLHGIASSSNDIQLLTRANDIKVLFCVSLTASSERDDSTIVISNLPSSITDKDISELITSTYGEVRSIQFESSHENSCYIVEFYDIQDASQALLEIQNTAPWGSSPIVSLKLRQDHERRRGQNLFALIGRWRQQGTKQLNGAMPSLSRSTTPSTSTVPATISTQSLHSPNRTPPSPANLSDGVSNQTHSSTSSVSHQQVSFQPHTQLVVGPDGQYQYIMVNTGYPAQAPAPAQYGTMLPPQPQIQPVQRHGSNFITPAAYDGQGGFWVQQTHLPMNGPGVASYSPHIGQTIISHQPMIDLQHGHTMPMYAPPMTLSHLTDSSISSGANSNNAKNMRNGTKDESTDHLILDIDAVKQGADTRTSLMVRNIPNKYTQSMLLSEFSKCGHGPGKIDFFYLPIDFRNKCNRGYAFVNFVDYRDIVSFHNAYNGQSWKVFKSEKICSITYARIQGKEGMMKRFQNSALLQKDQEYRPLVFSFDGQIIEDPVYC